MRILPCVWYLISLLSRVHSFSADSQKCNLEKNKLNIPHDICSGISEMGPKIGANDSTSVMISTEAGRMGSPKMTERNYYENEAKCTNSKGPEVYQSSSDRKIDSRAASFKVGDKKASTVICQTAPSNHKVEEIQANDQDEGSEAALQESDAHRKRAVLNEDINPVDPISVDKKRLLSVQSTLEGEDRRHLGAFKPANSKSSASLSLGEKSREETLIPSSSKKSILNDVSKVMKKVVDPTLETSGVPKSVSSSQKAGLSLNNKRHPIAKDHSLRNLSKKKLSPIMDIRLQERKLLTGSEAKSIKRHPGSEVERLKLEKVRNVDNSRPTTSKKKTILVGVDNQSTDMPSVTADERNPGDSEGLERARLNNSVYPQGLVDESQKTQMTEQDIFETELGASRQYPPAHDPASDADRREPDEPKKKIFNVPWHKLIKDALEQGKALVLQNLDPWFSSSEIEIMLNEVLHVSCEVRMLPPKNNACYTSGEALVLFKSKPLAEEAMKKLTENWLIWSKDERPVLASIAGKHKMKTSYNRGFFDLEHMGAGIIDGEAKLNAVATSHCSQPNTVEYEMGIQWRLLQERHAAAWALAAQEHQQAIDRIPQNLARRNLTK